MESVGFQVRLLRHCFLDNKSLLRRQGPRKANNGGLFETDLLTGVEVDKAIWLSLPPFLSNLLTSNFSTLLSSY